MVAMDRLLNGLRAQRCMELWFYHTDAVYISEKDKTTKVCCKTANIKGKLDAHQDQVIHKMWHQIDNKVKQSKEPKTVQEATIRRLKNEQNHETLTIATKGDQN